MHDRPRRATAAGSVLAVLAAPLGAQQPDAASAYEQTDVMIPMRDGVKLHTAIYAPKAPHGPLPFLMVRTPYGVEGAGGALTSSYKELAQDGYIFVFQDIRGRYGSEGQFVMQRPLKDPKDEKGIDEATDAWDTVDWLVKNVPNNNGRAGMLGVSYPGWTTAMAATGPHPALKAVAPQASPADMWLGDDFHHNGAFRLSYGFEYAAMMETSKENENFAFDRYDTYDWYLALGPLSNVNKKYLHGKIPTWNDYVAHPDYDAFWQRQTIVPALTSVKVPTLNVAGWWDQEDFYGPVRIYEALEKHDTKGLNYLVVGPWNHGGWSHGEGRKLGAIDFGSATSQYYREKVQAPWFAYWLKDQGKLDLPEALTFEAGSNTWRRWDAWPPRNRVQDRNLYFHAGGVLSFEAPGGAEGATGGAGEGAKAAPAPHSPTPPLSPSASYDEYVSDPAHPVPYRHRPIQATYFPHGSGWYTWLTEDQRFVDDRADVLSWESAPLERDVSIAGDVVAHLFASTSGTDSDWIVKLIDVYPEAYPDDWAMSGYQFMVSNEVFRGRYRNSFEKPQPIPANQVLPYTIGLHTQSYTFRKGHRIMVQVQSTWFPIIDRNPQTFVPNIFEAKASDFRKATQRVWRSAKYPSHVTVPVVTGPPVSAANP
ncbi:MAG TPA: CocE/NonD family hydrolase [Longimicrobiales bacterium]|nr:CocE/NonD family hydrolase [Longimicrobiales bacterium]